jgi:hypothetical protein
VPAAGWCSDSEGVWPGLAVSSALGSQSVGPVDVGVVLPVGNVQVQTDYAGHPAADADVVAGAPLLADLFDVV